MAFLTDLGNTLSYKNSKKFQKLIRKYGVD